MRARMVLEQGAFDPETVATMVRALEAAWLQIKHDANSPELVRLRLANRILELAGEGMRDETILAQAALDAVGPALRLRSVP